MNTRNIRLVSVAMICLSVLLAGSVAADERYGKQKVVYHINYDDPKKQKGALRNVQNHINAVGKENLDLKIVLHGNGLAMLLEPDAIKDVPKFKHANADDQMQATIDNLKIQGVEIQVCNNTIRGRKVNVEEHLYDVETGDIVPSGVAEVARLQQEGYVYIKP